MSNRAFRDELVERHKLAAPEKGSDGRMWFSGIRLTEDNGGSEENLRAKDRGVNAGSEDNGGSEDTSESAHTNTPAVNTDANTCDAHNGEQIGESSEPSASSAPSVSPPPSVGERSFVVLEESLAPSASEAGLPAAPPVRRAWVPPLTEFLHGTFVLVPGAVVAFQQLWREWENYCFGCNLEPGTTDALCSQLEARGYEFDNEGNVRGLLSLTEGSTA